MNYLVLTVAEQSGVIFWLKLLGKCYNTSFVIVHWVVWKISESGSTRMYVRAPVNVLPAAAMETDTSAL